MLSVERYEFSFYTHEIIDNPVAIGLRARMSFSAYVQLQIQNRAHQSSPMTETPAAGNKNDFLFLFSAQANPGTHTRKTPLLLLCESESQM